MATQHWSTWSHWVITGRVISAAQGVKGGGSGHISFITDVIIDPFKHLWGCKEQHNIWGGAAGWCAVRFTYRAENDSHVGGNHSSPNTIALGSTTLGEIREMDWTQRRGKGRETQRWRFKSHDLRWWGGGVILYSGRLMQKQNIDSPLIHRFCDRYCAVAEIEERIRMIQRLNSPVYRRKQ